MPQPGFYNDNEYRAYPFVYKNTSTGLPTSAVVDAGIVLGLTALDDGVTDYSVWLHSVSRTATGFNFTFYYGASSVAPTVLTFFRPDTTDAWVTLFAENEMWEGFMVAGPTTELYTALTVGQTTTFSRDVYQLEPARIQNLQKSYLRSISVANYDRLRVPDCSDATTHATRQIIVNASNLQGNIRLKEGYNCQITQTDRANELSVSAVKNSGAQIDAALCDFGSEVPLYVGEPLTPNSKFYGGGPACDELIATINGVGGSAINFVGGNGVAITTEIVDGVGTIKISKKENAQTNCATPNA
jgi:hypothetical protein